MSEENENPETTGQEQAQTMQNMPLFIHAQYIKDLSFENPKAPAALQAGQEQPAMDINFSMQARNLPGGEERDLFEVVLSVEVKAVRKEGVVFLIELQYGAVISLENMPEDQKHPMLLIEVPRFLFPFAREIIADLTQKAGYAPLLLTPINFRELYMQRFAQEQAGDGSAKVAQA